MKETPGINSILETLQCSYLLFRKESGEMVSARGELVTLAGSGEKLRDLIDCPSFHTGEKQKWITELPLPGQTRRWAEVRSQPIPSPRGEPELILASLTDVTPFKEAEEEMLRANKQLQSLSAHLLQVRDEERASLAREVHDDLGQILTAAKMETYLLRQETEKQGMAVSTSPVTELLDQAISRVQNLTSRLRPTLLERVSFMAALKDEAALFTKRTGILCEIYSSSESRPLEGLSSSQALGIFRIIQEALTNTARHSKARRVHISISHSRQLQVRISDDGRGIRVEEISHPDSFGLMGMRERARNMKGTLDIRPRQPHGTEITLTLPALGEPK